MRCIDSSQFGARSRPAARLLNVAELRDMGEAVERHREPHTGVTCIAFRNQFYKYGFLYKTVKVC